MSAHHHAPDPHWDALLDDSDADMAWREWQARLDRTADFAPYEQHPGPGPAEVLDDDPRRSSQ
jgi:hypothetical protein